MEHKYDVIGLMSGTSLDGLDVAYCCFSPDHDSWNFEIPMAETFRYPNKLRDALAAATALSGLELTHLDHELGKWIGETCSRFIGKNSLHPTFIASHGHTVFHQPQKGFTLQIGNPYDIMAQTALPVVCDFRSLDLALGGQGAPLVPVGDKLLFSSFDFCLNLGGISNISFDKEEKRIAFDICPVNMVLNYLSGKCGKEYDKDGELAAQGDLDRDLFHALNSLSYYDDPYPKSLGLEWVQQNVFPLLEDFKGTISTALHTFCHHIAFQISSVIQREGSGTAQKLLVTGGGAFNTFLMELLRKYIKNPIQVEVPDPSIVSFKEALVFAFLGVLRWNRKPNILKSVTGARFSSSGGTIIDNTIFN